MRVPHYERYRGKTTSLHPDIYSGFVVDLANMLAKACNFEYELQEVKDGKYGSINESGHWNGMVNELLTQVPLHASRPRRDVNFECFFLCFSFSRIGSLFYIL